MYLIYIEAIHCTFQIPILFTLYMKTEFDLNEFNTRYDSILKPYIIEIKINNFTKSQLQRELVTMFRDLIIFNQMNNESNTTISGAEQIPLSIIVHFKPLLIHYYNYLYLSDLYQRHLEYTTLIKKIIAFKRENVYFDLDYTIKTSIQKVNYKIITIPKIIINIESLWR